jgi:hypothetical protein
MIYQFKTGHTFQGVDAQTAGEELEQIRLQNAGKLRPQDVLENAADPESPIHGVFTWDDSKAAHEYRLSEARDFIKLVVVVDGQKGTPEPAFWNVTITTAPIDNDPESQPSKERYYQAANVIAKSPIEYESALQLMVRELASAQTGLERLRRLAPRGHRLKVDRASKLVGSAQDALE